MADPEPGDATESGLTSLGEPSSSGAAPVTGVVASVAVGDLVHGHRIERRLGSGGMGEVFAATRLRDEAAVALKVLARASATHLYRFKREFRALADVAHRNLVALHELVVPREGQAFFTMELVDGEPFTTYVRGPTIAGRLPNLERLERALRQLVDGIHELHGFGCLHRDLKPSNVLVDRSGRVVILDFGLISELDSHDEGLTHDGQMLGTPAYMAPEQALSGRAGPAADYYAVGVMLFECLTGQKPYAGSPMRVMMAKQDGEIPDPGAIVEGIPATLRSLCMQLLAREPSLRPTGRELIGLLGEGGSSSTAGGPAIDDTRSSKRTPFVGRERELELLRTARRDVVETGAAVTVLVHGHGGAGKSALVRQFLTRIRSREQALILAGRCLERESVPYKGVDAIIDALSVHLRRLPAAEAAALEPRHVAALIKLFPVLADVWAARGDAASLDATDQRRLALLALRELIQRLSARAPLILSIDDFHWADLDSVRLLASLLRPPDAPGLLLILSFRSEPSPALLELRDPLAHDGRDIRELVLEPLPEAEAIALALALMGAQPDPARAEAIARRSEGNPLFVTQLCLGLDAGAEELELDDILARRIAALAPGSRELLAIIAIAGGPAPQLAVVAALAASDSRGAEAAIDELLRLGLLLRGRLEAGTSPGASATTLSHLGADELVLELAHGQIRDVVLDGLDEATRARLHLALAAALERLGADPETLAEHLAHAGEHERAAVYTERGAEQAAEALAFARAAELYRRTLALLGDAGDEDRRRRLRIALVDQLVNLGHAAAAADLLLELATETESEAAVGLRRRAITQLARCGRIDEAIAIARELLAAIAEPMPRGHWGAVAMFVRETLRLRLRGERFDPRPEAEIPAAELARLDTLIAISTGLSIHEVMLTQALGSRALRLAFDAGDPTRLGLLLSYRYLVYAGIGQFERAATMAVDAREIAMLTDDPEVHRSNDLSDAMVAWFLPRLSKSKQMFGRLVARAEDEPVADWIRGFATLRYAELCLITGELALFRREHPRWLARAREQGNLHEVAALEGAAASVAVYYDELELARGHLDGARRCWQSSRYTFTNVTLDFAAAAVMIHAGELDEARAQIARMLESLRRSGLIHIRAVAEFLWSLRAKCLIAQLLEDPGDRELLSRARGAVRMRRGTREPTRIGDSLIYRAALRSLIGDEVGARKLWRRALQHCERHDMNAYVAALHLRLATVTTGREAAEFEGLGLAYLSAQGIARRIPFVDMLVPAAAPRSPNDPGAARQW